MSSWIFPKMPLINNNDHSELYSRMVEKALLEDTPERECERCKIHSKMVGEVYISASPIGAGGEYELCYGCAVEEIDNAESSLQEYFGSVL